MRQPACVAGFVTETTVMHENARLGVEHLYKVFRYTIGQRIQGCSCCVDPNAEIALAGQSLRSVGRDLLGSYTFNAMTTWGSEQDFKHFLPRILETLHELPIQPQVVFGKLEFVSWREKWPSEEVEAVECFVWHLWETALSSTVLALPLEAILECAGIAGMDQRSFLDMALTSKKLHAGKHLASFICKHAEELIGKHMAWQVWRHDSEQAVAQWFRDNLDALELLLYEAFELNAGHSDIDEWEDAIDTIALLRYG